MSDSEEWDTLGATPQLKSLEEHNFKFWFLEDENENAAEIPPQLKLFFIAYNCESRIFLNTLKKSEEFEKLIRFILKTLDHCKRVDNDELGNDLQGDCFKALTNLSANVGTAKLILRHSLLMEDLALYCFDEKYLDVYQKALVVLRNLTHDADNVKELLNNYPEFVDNAVYRACNNNIAENYGFENYALFLTNITQTEEGRALMMNPTKALLPQVFPLLGGGEDKYKVEGRVAIAGLLKNCCMGKEHHEWLLSPDIDILGTLVLPLAGPGRLTDEEYENMPFELQYLPETKSREMNCDVKQNIIDALFQLCLKRKSRETIRKSNVYYILREYHLWEEFDSLMLYTEDLINVIIRTEEEIGVDDLTDGLNQGEKV